MLTINGDEIMKAAQIKNYGDVKAIEINQDAENHHYNQHRFWLKSMPQVSIESTQQS